MADLKESGLAILSRTSVTPTDTPATHVLLIVPPGKRAIIDSVILHTNSGSLTGMSDVKFTLGTDGSNVYWLEETGIVDMTTAYDWMVLRADSDEFAMINGDDATATMRNFNMRIVTGSTGAFQVNVDVIGILV